MCVIISNRERKDAAIGARRIPPVPRTLLDPFPSVVPDWLCSLELHAHGLSDVVPCKEIDILVIYYLLLMKAPSDPHRRSDWSETG